MSLHSQTLYKIQNGNGLYGYIDRATGDTIVSCRYGHVYSDTIKQIGFVFDGATKKIACLDNKGRFLFNVFSMDNGPDFIREGLFRIINEKNLIGFADSSGNVVIPPIFRFAYPFSRGKAKVTFTGESKRAEDDEHYYWDSDIWFYISKPSEAR